jgi:glycosyltransferase involved in cell wall biosynthesis
MKIGLFGNTNNTMYSIAEGLRVLGHDVVLIITSKELLHRPESSAPGLRSGYPHWIVDASELKEEDYFDLSPNLRPVIDQLSRCDALMLNDVGPSLLQILDKPAIVFLTGSDLEYYANPRMVEARTQGWGKDYKEGPEGRGHIRNLEDFIQRQRWGIKTAMAVRYFPRGLVPAGDQLLDEIGVHDEKRLFLRAIDYSRIEPVPAPHNQPIRVFCATRLTWKLPIEVGRSSLDYKGSDIMIRGLALFYRTTGTRLDIQIVRKGLHVKELEMLIAEEGLTDQVTWSDEMSLIELDDRFTKSDIVIEQLGGSIIGGTGLRAMATGRPLIGNAHSEMFEVSSGEEWPICRAKTPAEVCAHLQRLVFDPNERERMGKVARRHVEEHCTNLATAQTCLQRFKKSLEPQNRFENSH